MRSQMVKVTNKGHTGSQLQSQDQKAFRADRIIHEEWEPLLTFTVRQ
jgi:hypothetical protein